MSGWLAVDVLSILPFGLFLSNSNDYSLLLKIAKMPRFYKMVFYGYINPFIAKNWKNYQKIEK